MAFLKEVGLSQPVQLAIFKMGFEAATNIQQEVIPPAMLGADIIGKAQTGTGKTAAFGIPLAEKIEKETGKIKGLVITPTRELAVQVAEELNSIGQVKGVSALPVYGGQDIKKQIRSLKNHPQIIVGTPGRLIDHMNRKTIRLQDVGMVILDEADEMLNMGFIEDIEIILKDVPRERQTMLFSATMPQPIQELARKFMNDPKFIQIKPREVTVPSTEQYYFEVQERQKFDSLCRVLDMQSPELAIVFCRTKKRVDELDEALTKRGYSAEAIHGDLTQARRDSVMRNFRRGTTEILVATDVAARGLDVGGVTHIYNFDIPQDAENYVHRIGRTGRLGRAGLANTFVTSRELGQLRLIERTINRNIARQMVPSTDETLEGLQQVTVDKIMNVVEKRDNQKHKKLAEELLKENDSVTLLSAALKLLTREPECLPVQLTEESSFRKKSPKDSKSAKKVAPYPGKQNKKNSRKAGVGR